MKKLIFNALERFNNDSSGTLEALVFFLFMITIIAAIIK